MVRPIEPERVPVEVFQSKTRFHRENRKEAKGRTRARNAEKKLPRGRDGRIAWECARSSVLAFGRERKESKHACSAMHRLVAPSTASASPSHIPYRCRTSWVPLPRSCAYPFLTRDHASNATAVPHPSLSCSRRRRDIPVHPGRPLCTPTVSCLTSRIHPPIRIHPPTREYSLAGIRFASSLGTARMPFLRLG